MGGVGDEMSRVEDNGSSRARETYRALSNWPSVDMFVDDVEIWGV